MTTERAASRRMFLMASLGATAALAAPHPAQASEMAVDEGRFVHLNGTPQWVAIRGRSLSNPLLLMLGGGPGVPTSYLMPAFADWTRDFTMVLWDQPGSGGTFLKNGGVAGLGLVTVDRYAADGLALADYLAERFPGRKIVLLGYSWGSMVGLTMVSRRPERFAAYVGTGQAVNVKQADALSYRLVLDDVRASGQATAVAALEKLGPPPYDFGARQTKQQYATALTPLERANAAKVAPLLAPSSPAPWLWPQDLGPYDARAAFLATQRQSYAETASWSTKAVGDRFRLPLFFFQGEQDRNTVTSLVQTFAAEVQAPRKVLALIPGAGHGTIPYCCAELKELIDRHLKRSII